MKLIATKLFPFSRQPLSTLSKITIAALLSIAGSGGVIWVFSTIHNPGLLAFLLLLLLCAGLLTTSLRWMPLLGTLMGGATLFLFTRQPYVIVHLTRPKESIFFFVLILIALASAGIALGAGMNATMQNYLTRERHAPRWWWAMLSGIAGMVIGAILITVIA